MTVQDDTDPPTTGHAERRGEPGESEDGLVKAGEYADGTSFYFGEFVEWPEDDGQEAER